MATEVLQQLNLSQGSLGENLLAEYIGDLLNGNSLVRLVVYGGTRKKLVSAMVVILWYLTHSGGAIVSQLRIEASKVRSAKCEQRKSIRRH